MVRPAALREPLSPFPSVPERRLDSITVDVMPDPTTIFHPGGHLKHMMDSFNVTCLGGKGRGTGVLISPPPPLYPYRQRTSRRAHLPASRALKKLFLITANRAICSMPARRIDSVTVDLMGDPTEIFNPSVRLKAQIDKFNVTCLNGKGKGFMVG